METSTWIAGSALAMSLLTTVYGIFNRAHIKSKCCGKVLEASIEIDRNVDTPTLTVIIPKDAVKNDSQIK